MRTDAVTPAASAPVRLEAQDLVLSWDGRVVCEGVTFCVRQGELLGLVGRSGSGKTTIFHALAGLTRPASGRVLLDGRDVTGVPGSVSYMLQKDLLLEQHTIVDNVSMPLRVAGAKRREARSQASARFEEFGLQGTEALYPSQLSGGMRQRAALLRTYFMDNDVVLMDEPFSALDAFTRRDMQQWFLAMLTRLGLSSVLVTHDVDEAVAMCDRIMVLAPPSPMAPASRASGGPASQEQLPASQEQAPAPAAASEPPATAAPATIAGIVDVPAGRARREGFLLTDEALRVKREVLALLA